jgi:glycosyltransferase involved in cell wall biosynthesis
LFRNGGIGTANTGLAFGLVEAGFEVTVAFVDPTGADDPDKQTRFEDVVDGYRARGLTLEAVARHPLLRAGHEDHLAASYSVQGYLRGRGFDVVFFNECGGQGYYSLLAKRAGQFPDAPRMFVVTHGSNEWVLELNAQLYWSLHPIAVSYLERRSAELADVLISPSRYLVDWMSARGWKLPERTRVIQNLLPPVAASAPPAPPSDAVSEIVFFGRLEARKGLDLFCEAIAGLSASRDFTVTFVGKFSRIGGLHSGVYIIEASRKWRVSPQIITHLDSAAALAYLGRPGVLAVIPSLAENSPCVVAECLLAGIPFIATNSGGAAELIAPEDRERCLVAPNAAAIEAKLAEALAGGRGPARMAVPQSASRAQWLSLMSEPPPAPAPIAAPRPPVSICLARDAAVEPSAKAFEAIIGQSYRDFEIVVVEYGAAADDDRAAVPTSGRVRGFRRASRDRAAARNAAAARARGDWLLFVDERDVILKPNCLEGFMEAAANLGADIITGPALEFGQGEPIDGWDGQLGSIPIGAHVELAAFENCLGQSAILIGRSAFEGVGGFQPGIPESIEDRLLLTRAVLAGARLEISPEPLFWRRVARARVAEAHERGAEQRLILRAYAGRDIRLVEHALESVLASGPRNRDRLHAALAGLGNAAKDLATRLSFAPQHEGVDMSKPFVEYCIARGRIREAYEFARLAQSPALMEFARGAAEAAAEKAAFGAMRVAERDEWHAIPLGRQVAERVRSVRELRDDALVRGGEIVVAHAMPLGTTILKAPAACPPRAARIEASVAVESDHWAKARLALAVCEPFATLNLDEGRVRSREGGAWWSGWIAPAGDGAETRLAAQINPPPDRPLDVFLISRLDGFFARRARVTWRSVGAEVNVLAQSTSSAIELDASSSALPRHVVARGEPLTPARDFNARYFVPGDPTTHHPLPGRPALVRIAKAIFPGATGVRALFSVENENAHPVEFAFWARKSTDPAKDTAGLENSEGFSGWTSVRSPFQQHQATLTLAGPARQPLDLYLATRVVEFPDVDYCHAAWHDFFVLENLNVSSGLARRGA